MRTLLDANAILRHLLDDIPEQAEIVAQAIEDGAQTIPEVIAECVYVLSGVYGLDRKTISDALIALLGEIECERRIIAERALRIYSESKLDFVDCILASTNKISQQPVLTFDKKLKRFIG